VDEEWARYSPVDENGGVSSSEFRRDWDNRRLRGSFVEAHDLVDRARNA